MAQLINGVVGMLRASVLTCGVRGRRTPPSTEHTAKKQTFSNTTTSMLTLPTLPTASQHHDRPLGSVDGRGLGSSSRWMQQAMSMLTSTIMMTVRASFHSHLERARAT